MLAKFKEYHVCIQTFSFHLAYFTLLEDIIFDEFLPRSMSSALCGQAGYAAGMQLRSCVCFFLPAFLRY